MAPTLRLRALGPRASMTGLRRMSTVPSWATVDPFTMSAASPAVGRNLVGGKWCDAASQHSVVDPLNGEAFVKVPNTTVGEIGPFVERMASCPRSGVHNPIKNVGRYLMLGEVMVKGAHELGKPEVAEFFAHLIHRLVPKSKAQCAGEPAVTRKWMENYGSDQVRVRVRVRVRVGARVRVRILRWRTTAPTRWAAAPLARARPGRSLCASARVCPPSLAPSRATPDQVRYLATSPGVPGDYPGQTSVGMRMPYGGVSVITPFNFPLEICALQTCSALFMGNRVPPRPRTRPGPSAVAPVTFSGPRVGQQ